MTFFLCPNMWTISKAKTARYRRDRTHLPPKKLNAPNHTDTASAIIGTAKQHTRNTRSRIPLVRIHAPPSQSPRWSNA